MTNRVQCTRRRVLFPLLAATAAAAIAAALLTGGAAAARAGADRAAAMPSKVPMPMPIRVLGRATWEGMKIEARSMAPATFSIFTGTSQHMVTPQKSDSFHLMVLLSDARSGAPIPYSSVWATITEGDKVVYDERQWPMLSQVMGVHYGNNVALPGAGTYKLTLLIGPPQAARHPEYMKVWLKPHRVSFTFTWKPAM